MKFTKRSVPDGKSKEGNKNFLSLKNGEEIKGLIRGELYEFSQVWPKGGEKTIYPAGDKRGSARFKVNFVIHEAGNYRALIWEFGTIVNNQLAQAQEKFGDLTKQVIKIKRYGEGQKTLYAVDVLEAIKPEILEKIKDIALNILEPKEAAGQSFDLDNDFGAPPEEIDDADRLPF